MKNFKANIKKIIALGETVFIIITASGCAKKVECEIPTYHAHKYVSTDGRVRYFDNEYENYKGFDRQEEYIELDEKDKDLYHYIDNRDLLKIDDNLDLIKSIQDNNKDYYEYRYAYTYLQPIPIIISTGKSTIVSFSVVPRTHHSWTRDENHPRLTGEKRICHYEYTSYKIEKDEYGKYVLIPSPNTDDIISTKDEYPYIKNNFYKIVNLSDRKEIDYEDMEHDEVERIKEDDDVKEQGKALSKKL